MKIGKFYTIQGYTTPLEFIGIIKGDYVCDHCQKNHADKTLPKLYSFQVSKDNWAKYGTTCIKKVLK